MADHGYSVSRSVCLSEADEGLRKLFLSDDADLGIHAFIGADGAIMLETAKMDESVRGFEDGALVERRPELDPRERMRLVEQQHTFCDLHPKLIADLADYGVTLSNIKDKPVSEGNALVFLAPGAEEAFEEPKARRRVRGGEQLVEREMR